ncbi:MAG: hypothetical protein KDH96_02425 [Candidatus Riesia sp.]|nr:hypothetical protein [Candidatus Riesia sp.]
MNQPYIILNNLFSPKICEQLVNDLIITCDIVENDKQTTTVQVTDQIVNDFIINLIKPIYPHINNHFNVTCNKVENIFFSYLKGETESTPLKSFNSVFSKEANTWIRTEYNDFTISLFLSSYFDPQDIFDEEYEHVGGKIQLPQHNVSILGERGSVFIHPSDPHFIRNISEVAYGTCMILDILISCENIYLYDPISFNDIKELV